MDGEIETRRRDGDGRRWTDREMKTGRRDGDGWKTERDGDEQIDGDGRRHTERWRRTELDGEMETEPKRE